MFENARNTLLGKDLRHVRQHNLQSVLPRLVTPDRNFFLWPVVISVHARAQGMPYPCHLVHCKSR